MSIPGDRQTYHCHANSVAMKYAILVFITFVVVFRALAQEPQKRYDFPIILTVHFPALAMPFRNLDLNFRNIGVGLGTEVTLNREGTWVQQLHVAWLRNRHAGNELVAYSQLAWRPDIGDNGFTEVKAGIAYVYGFTASPAMKPVNGDWVSSGHKGKGMFALPVGVAFGYHDYHEDVRYSPFIGYQFMIVTHYNKTVPLMPQTLVQTGLSISK